MFVLGYLWCKLKVQSRVGKGWSPIISSTLRALPPANLGETVSDCDKSDKTDRQMTVYPSTYWAFSFCFLETYAPLLVDYSYQIGIVLV